MRFFEVQAFSCTWVCSPKALATGRVAVLAVESSWSVMVVGLHTHVAVHGFHRCPSLSTGQNTILGGLSTLPTGAILFINHIFKFYQVFRYSKIKQAHHLSSLLKRSAPFPPWNYWPELSSQSNFWCFNFVPPKSWAELGRESACNM